MIQSYPANVAINIQNPYVGSWCRTVADFLIAAEQGETESRGDSEPSSVCLPCLIPSPEGRWLGCMRA